MGQVKAIRNEDDYEAALERIDELMDVDPSTPEGDELDVLVDLVEHYETKAHPIPAATPLAALAFRMEQDGLTPRDLVPHLGSSARVSEVLSGKRALTLAMARALHVHLGIPAELLLQRQESGSSSIPEWEKFPLAEMVKRGWIPKTKGKTNAEQAVRAFMKRAGVKEDGLASLYRKNDHLRANAKTNPYSLKAWCWQVMKLASEQKLPKYKRGTVDFSFLKDVARLSWAGDGPQRAQTFLRKHGIALVILPHLPKTHLDGAVFKLASGAPAIGLTLRYDRIDSFWFSLLHELAHVGRHLDVDSALSFVDDLTIAASNGKADIREVEADAWAQEALIPNEIWNESEAKRSPTTLAITELAKKLDIHPAMIAGRIRRERNDYRLLSHFVGAGHVRRQFGIS
jgi:HTH-type transcriptional regulator / antitoxin HigA